MSEILVTKGNGEREPFDKSKLKESLLRSGATVFVADDISSAIEKQLKPGRTTQWIYDRAFKQLKKRASKRSAATYALRRSIETLGPTGFPFEMYVAKLFEAKGYQTQIGVTIQGKCARHEVDVIAWNDDNVLFVEAKFHNQRGMKSDTKTTLYIKARFDDLMGQPVMLDGTERTMTRGMLITNTKFTHSSKSYARCAGTFDMISWEYPKHGNLYDIVLETKLHPITSLPSLTNFNKESLINAGVVDCMAVKDNPELLEQAGITGRKQKEIIDNIDVLCSVDSYDKKQ